MRAHSTNSNDASNLLSAGHNRHHGGIHVRSVRSCNYRQGMTQLNLDVDAIKKLELQSVFGFGGVYLGLISVQQCRRERFWSGLGSGSISRARMHVMK